MKWTVLTSGTFLFVLLLLACSSNNGTEKIKSSPESAAQNRQPVNKETWEVEWEKIVRAAQKEGRLVVYSSAPVQDALRNAFSSKYGIQYEGMLVRGGELAQKLLTERRSGLYTIDVYIGGNNTIISSLKPAGTLTPLEPALILPEVLDSKAWYENKLPWVDAQKTTFSFMGSPYPVILVNTQTVNTGEVRGYRDLLNPRWKGKIVINDPTVPGAGNSTFRHVAWLILNLDYWREFVKQEPIITRDQRLQVEWIAQGKYPIAISPQGAIVNDFRAAGATIEYIQTQEGVYLTSSSGNLALVSNAPHPNAAKLFVNWLLSKEGQRVFSLAFGAQSTREDISTEGIPADRIRQPGVKYITGGMTEEWEFKANEQTKHAIEIFSPLLKR